MLVEQLLVLFIVSSFAYLVGVLIGKVSDKELKKSAKNFIKFDKYIWEAFMILAIIFALIETWYAVIGVLISYLVVINAKKKMHRFTVFPLVLGLSAAFRNELFIVLLSLITFYILIFGMVHHRENQLKIVLKNQVRYIILTLIGLFIPITINTVFGLSNYQLDICAILVAFLSSIVLVGEYEHLFKGKSGSKLA